MPRTITRPELLPAPRPRALVRGRTTDHHVEFDPRPVYDFLISLVTVDGLQYDLLPEDRKWLDAARAALSPERQRDLDECFGESHNGLCHGVGLLPYFHPEVRTARELVELVGTMDTRQLVREMAGEIMVEPVATLIDRALDGDASALDQLPKHLSEYECAPTVELLRAPQAWIDRLRALLDAWLVPFEQIEARIAAIQERDVALREADAARLTAAELIETVTGGLRWLPEPGVTRVVLAPTYFARPYNHVSSGPGFRLFAYPVASEALDHVDVMAPPEAMLRLYRALGDESRLRILRLLAREDLYLTEIAQQMELSKPTIKHHLALLRAAGLVTVSYEGNLTYYSLRRSRLTEAGAELLRFLP